MGTKGGFVHVLGGRVSYTVAGSGPATPLLVIHGIPGTSSRYLAPLSQLAADRPVIFYDQLGGGASDRPLDSALWTLSRFVDEIQTVRAALGLRDVHVFGHSWGGLLAIEHALGAAGDVRSLVLASVPVSIPDYVTDIRRLRQALPPALRAALESHEHDGTTAAPEYQAAVTDFRQRHLYRGTAWASEFLEALGAINGEVFASLWGLDPFDCTGSLRRHDRTSSLTSIEVPVLVTVGRHDMSTPARADSHARCLPLGQLVVFEHSAHLSILEEPELYAATVGAFLRSVDARA